LPILLSLSSFRRLLLLLKHGLLLCSLCVSGLLQLLQPITRCAATAKLLASYPSLSAMMNDISR
jgi:hypothetical protein